MKNTLLQKASVARERTHFFRERIIIKRQREESKVTLGTLHWRAKDGRRMKALRKQPELSHLLWQSITKLSKRKTKEALIIYSHNFRFWNHIIRQQMKLCFSVSTNVFKEFLIYFFLA